MREFSDDTIKTFTPGLTGEQQFIISESHQFASVISEQSQNYVYVNDTSAGYEEILHTIADVKKLLAIAEGGLMKINDNLIAMQKKALQAASEGLILAERFIISVKFQHLNDEIDRIVRESKYGSFVLLDGSFYGHEIELEGDSHTRLVLSIKNDLSPTSLRTRHISVRSSNDAAQALEIIENGIRTVSKNLQRVGEWINQILFKDDELKVSPRFRNDHVSQRKEFDLQSAREKLETNKFQIMQNTAVAMIEQSNSESKITRLLFKRPE